MTMNLLPLRHYTACKRHSFRLVPALIAGIALTGSSFPSDSAATVYRYRHTKGTTVDTVFRSIRVADNKVVISYADLPYMTSRAVCGMDFRIFSWCFEDNETGYAVTAERMGDTIRIAGQKGKKPVRKSFPIDGSPWYQAMEFSLLPFLKGCSQTCEFWMIRPTDMNAFKMNARRDGMDTVLVDGRSQKVLRVMLSPSGIAGKFWKATYWYCANDFSFVKCSLPQGIPGSPPVIIESIGTATAD
jgi:hypothetical protein